MIALIKFFVLKLDHSSTLYKFLRFFFRKIQAKINKLMIYFYRVFNKTFYYSNLNSFEIDNIIYRKTLIDDFYTGQFHFKKNPYTSNLSENIRRALAKNDQDNLLNFLSLYKSKDKIKRKKLQKKRQIKIAVFCDYYCSSVFNQTMAIYNKYNQNLKHTLILINDKYAPKKIKYIDVLNVKNMQEALKLCDDKFDVVIDCNGPLRDKNFYSIISKTKCFTINSENFLAPTYDRNYDAMIISKDLKPGKFDTSEYLLKLNSFGSWEPIEIEKKFLTINKNFQHRIDFGFIGDQFKLGKEFLNYFSLLSHNYKCVFVGLRNIIIFQKNLKKYNWNTKNVFYTPFFNLGGLIYFLRNNVKLVVDTIPYSGGSSTLTCLNNGIPLFAKWGEYYVDGVSASMLKEMNLNKLIYNNVDDLIKFNDKLTERKWKMLSDEVLIKSKKSNYFNPEKYLYELEVELKKYFNL